MRCMSVHSIVGLALTGSAVWFARQLYNFFPTVRTRGHYRSDASSAFGKWFDKMHITNFCARACAVDLAGTCRVARTFSASGLRVMVALSMIRICFWTQFVGPRRLLGAHTIGMTQDADVGLTSVVSQSLASVAVDVHN